MSRKSKRPRALVADEHILTHRKKICHGLGNKPDLVQEHLVNLAFSRFPQHTDSLRSLCKNLKTRKWRPVSESCAACKSQVVTKRLYTSSLGEREDETLGWPVLVPAERCWKDGSSPSVDALLSFCDQDPSAKSAVIEHNGTHARDKTMQDVLHELRVPPSEQTLVAHNVPLEDFAMLDVDAIPFKNLRPRLPHDTDYSMNVTPANTVVDIHIDQGTCGLSIGLGQPTDDPKLKVHKIWLLWPPTAHNLRTYEYLRRSTQEKGPCLPRSQDLEDGVIASAGIEAGIVLPPGWLHATITTNSGFLGGITFTTPKAIAIASRMFAIDLNVSPSIFILRLPQYCDALHEARLARLDAGSLQAAIEIWMCCIEPSLRRMDFKCGSKQLIRECKKLLTVWKSYFNGKETEAVQIDECAGCGWSGDEDITFAEHFWKTHLKIVMPVGYRSPYHGRKVKAKS